MAGRRLYLVLTKTTEIPPSKGRVTTRDAAATPTAGSSASAAVCLIGGPDVVMSFAKSAKKGRGAAEQGSSSPPGGLAGSGLSAPGGCRGVLRTGTPVTALAGEGQVTRDTRRRTSEAATISGFVMRKTSVIVAR